MGSTDRSAKLDAVLQSAHKVRLGQLDYVQVVRLLHVLDVLVGLALRVDDEWPPVGIAAHTQAQIHVDRQRERQFLM